MIIDIYPLMVLLLAVYSLFYGAYCWESAEFVGLLIGSIFYIIGVIIAVLVKRIREEGE